MIGCAKKAAARRLEARAKEISGRFAAEVRDLMDCPDMTDSQYCSAVMQSLRSAQGYAEDVERAE